MRRNKKGFTLIEIIIVLIIIAILAAIAVPAMMKYINDAKQDGLITDLRLVHLAVTYAVVLASADGVPESTLFPLGSPKGINPSATLSNGEYISDILKSQLSEDLYDLFFGNSSQSPTRVEANYTDGVTEVHLGVPPSTVYIYKPGEPLSYGTW